MTNFSMLSLLIILEIFVVLLILFGVIIWRLRKLQRRDRIQFIDAGEHLQTPSLYLDSEAAKTHSHAETLHDRVLHAALGARAGILRYESDLARHPVIERDAQVWAALARSIDAVLVKQGYSIPPARTADAHDDDASTRDALVEQQNRTILHLRDYIQQLLEKLGHPPTVGEDIQHHLNELENTNKELMQCVTILEDENSFLRDQIAALLTLDRPVSQEDSNPVRV